MQAALSANLVNFRQRKEDMEMQRKNGKKSRLNLIALSVPVLQVFVCVNESVYNCMAY